MLWRKEWDSNPRKLLASPVFKTGAFNRSAILPEEMQSAGSGILYERLFSRKASIANEASEAFLHSVVKSVRTWKSGSSELPLFFTNCWGHPASSRLCNLLRGTLVSKLHRILNIIGVRGRPGIRHDVEEAVAAHAFGTALEEIIDW